ncbi:MAG TPA: GNAT family N-acetyltransferase, partial [Candidatus Latescibacteria bacterium]|nr:GNAT family N-acetyltransferase [Candidatus Latescibacterota bacterium]
MRTKGETDTADIGHELDPRHWGNGFATEAMSRLVTFAFERAEMIP